MKVAVVYHEADPEAGGYFTIQTTLLETLRAVAASTRHEFLYYSVGPNAPVSGDARWLPEKKLETYRSAADRVGRRFPGTPAARLSGPSRLDRALAPDGIGLVWFISNHVEDSDLPFVFTVWDIAHRVTPWFPEVSSEGTWEQRERLHARYLPRASRVIVPNAAGAEQVTRFYDVPLERQLLLPHPTPKFALDAAAEPARPRDVLERYGIAEPYLLYPAQLWPHKNHVGAIDALRAIKESGRDYQLVLVGSEPQSVRGQREHIERVAAQMGVKDRVHFLGFVDLTDLVALYQHAFALLYLSFFGPENLPPLEAFALGCPVIYGDVPGAREQLGDAALIVDPTDSSAIAAAVRSLEAPELREKLTKAGSARSAELTPEAYVNGVVEFIDTFDSVRRCWP